MHVLLLVLEFAMFYKQRCQAKWFYIEHLGGWYNISSCFAFSGNRIEVGWKIAGRPLEFWLKNKLNGGEHTGSVWCRESNKLSEILLVWLGFPRGNGENLLEFFCRGKVKAKLKYVGCVTAESFDKYIWKDLQPFFSWKKINGC